jgi:hypothetical protein
MDYKFSVDADTDMKAKLLLSAAANSNATTNTTSAGSEKTAQESAKAHVSIDALKQDHGRTPFTTEAAVMQMSMSHYR